QDDSLTSLNTAFSKEGAYIYIPKNKMPKKPIQILHLSTGHEAALMLQPRNLIVVEQNAEVQIIERHQSLTENEVFTNSVTEILRPRMPLWITTRYRTMPAAPPWLTILIYPNRTARWYGCTPSV